MDALARIDRRAFLARGAALGAGCALGSAGTALGRARVRPEPVLREGAFRHGVAAGTPSERSITLWTRVSDLERSGRVVLEVAREPDFRGVVHRSEVRVAQVRGFTARAVVPEVSLRPGEQYFYRFATRAASSPVGRLRTARPADSREPVRIGFFSCQDYQSGYYTALAGLGAGGPRPRRVPGRLRLRADVPQRPARAARPDRRQPRQRRSDAAGVPRQVRAVPLRRAPPGAARRARGW